MYAKIIQGVMCLYLYNNTCLEVTYLSLIFTTYLSLIKKTFNFIDCIWQKVKKCLKLEYLHLTRLGRYLHLTMSSGMCQHLETCGFIEYTSKNPQRFAGLV